MTYGQLSKFIEKMTEDQKKMPVIVATGEEYLEMGLLLNLTHNDNEEGLSIGQPILS